MKDARRYSFQPPESDDRAAHVVHFLSALYTLGLETSLQRGAVHKSRGLPWLVRLSNLFQQRL